MERSLYCRRPLDPRIHLRFPETFAEFLVHAVVGYRVLSKSMVLVLSIYSQRGEIANKQANK